MSNGISEWAVNLISTEPYIALASIVINSFHLLILSRKSMRTSSTNAIMTAIALSIIGWMLKSMAILFRRVYNSGICSPPGPYILSFVHWISKSFQDHCMRCTALLGISLALVRVLAMSYPVGSGSGRFNNVSQTSFGWKSCLFVFLVSLFLSSCSLQREMVKEARYLWTPDEDDCQGLFPENYTQPIYIVASSKYAIYGGLISLDTYMIVDSIVSKIIPCIMYPILTVLLVLKLKKFARNRDKLFSDRKKSQKDSTTKLVICITVAFIISELPRGVLTMKQALCEDNDCYIDTSAMMLLTTPASLLVTITHMPISLALSFQYRDTVKTLLRIDKKNEVNPEQEEYTTRVIVPT